jgi:cephalosporin hydroxylase
MTEKSPIRLTLGAGLLTLLVALNGIQFYLLALSRDPVFGTLEETSARLDEIVRRLPPDPNDALTHRFHELFYDKTIRDVDSIRWLGIPTMQNPNDVWVTQEIMWEVRPDFIIETGTAFGGSAALWATILEQINPNGRVITIDMGDRVTDARDLPIFQRKVDFLQGSSTAPEILSDVTRRVAGRRAIVLLDSDHSKSHVLNELNAYAPLVEVGSYLIVQDTNLNGHPVVPYFGPGPMEAVEEFLKSDDRFEPDAARDRKFLFTMHPSGYLKRVR